MKRIIEFPLENGSCMYVEVDEPEEGLTRVSHGDVIEQAHQTLEKSLERVKPAAQVILEKLQSLSDSPDEIEVQFGLKLNAATGVVLASAAIEANYNVKVKWVKDKAQPKAKK